jgi:hypothetical protein
MSCSVTRQIPVAQTGYLPATLLVSIFGLIYIQAE